MPTNNSPCIEIPAELPHGKTWGQWTIQHCLDKLKAKYASFYSLEFDGYATARAAQDPTWLDRIEAADLLVTRLMASNFRDKDVLTVMEAKDKIDATLKNVSQDLTLYQNLDEDAWQRIEDLFQIFTFSGVRLAKMTKVLCVKRPKLIPMLDSYVLGFLFEKAWPKNNRATYAQAGVTTMKQMRTLLHHGKNLAALQTLSTAMNAWLRQQVTDRPAPVLAPIRILESLLWFDWAGYEMFGWVHEKGGVRRR